MSLTKPDKIQAEKLIGTVVYRQRSTFTDKQSIVYSLAIGFNQDPLRQQDLPFTYEIHEDFTPFPTAATVAHGTNMVIPLLQSAHMPKFNPFALLHGEQKLVMVKDKIELGLEYEHEATLIDCIDKGKNAIIWFQINSYMVNEGKRELAYICYQSVFIKGIGGFGFKGKGVVQSPPAVPNTKPDFVLKVQTFPDQAILYRLTGDRNPLHVDPNVAKSQGFEKPIIHGMATYGTVARVFVQQILKNNASQFGSYHARFIGHVFPGEELALNLWKKDERVYIFEAWTVERKTKVLVGYFELKVAAKI